MNISEEFKKLFERDLLKLKEEVNAYLNEDDMWIKQGEIKNSAGNLAMHLAGNLQHFIGQVLNESGYIRQRSFEFDGKLSRKELITEIEKTIEAVNSFFTSANNDIYEQSYPLEVFGHPMTCFYFISHLQGHLNYHLGQVNYHRRILSK